VRTNQRCPSAVWKDALASATLATSALEASPWICRGSWARAVLVLAVAHQPAATAVISTATPRRSRSVQPGGPDWLSPRSGRVPGVLGERDDAGLRADPFGPRFQSSKSCPPVSTRMDGSYQPLDILGHVT
jgi:hypothetical protein